jgi:hypothetical protein
MCIEKEKAYYTFSDVQVGDLINGILVLEAKRDMQYTHVTYFDVKNCKFGSTMFNSDVMLNNNYTRV